MKRARTPASLPRRFRWAADEMVQGRLEKADLRSRNMELMRQLAIARGADPVDALFAGLEELRK